MAKKQYDYDVALMTAVVVETTAAKRMLDNWTAHTYPDDPYVTYFTGTFTSGGKERKIVLAQQSQMGMTACALLSMKVIERFRPRYLIMVGIAAGIGGDRQIYGDVIVPDVIWEYSTGKFVGADEAPIRFGDVGFLPRPTSLEMDPDLRTLIDKVSQSKEHEFMVHLGPMACGSSVVANRSFVERRVHALMPGTVGLDMESYSIFYAARNCTAPRPKALVIKSICDYANNEKSDQYQKFAAYTSSQFAKWLMENKLDFEFKAGTEPGSIPAEG